MSLAWMSQTRLYAKHDFFTTKRIHNKITDHHFLIFMITDNNNKLQFSHNKHY